MSKATDERIEERRATEADLRERLAAAHLDGPHRFPEGGLFGPGMFSSGRDRFAVCLICGAMVLLNDVTDDRPNVERSATLHARWHEELP